MLGEILDGMKIPEGISVQREGDSWARMSADGNSVTIRTNHFDPAAQGYMSDWQRDSSLERMGQGCTITIDRAYGAITFTSKNAEMFARVIRCAGQLAKKVEQAQEPLLKDWREEREKRLEAERVERERVEREREAMREKLRIEREKQQAEQAKLREELDTLVAERKEMLLNEYLDSDVKVGIHGYKSVVRAHIRAREQFDGTWEPYIEYVYANDKGRPQGIRKIKRLEIKDGANYKLIWNDVDLRGIRATVRGKPETKMHSGE